MAIFWLSLLKTLFDPNVISKKGEGIGLRNIRERVQIIYENPGLIRTVNVNGKIYRNFVYSSRKVIMTEKIRTLIVEDEELARNLLKSYLKDQESIELIHECENGFDGVKMINELKPDLIFLDIQMPKITGFEMLELLDHKPEIIFTTAYDQYALKAFDFHAADYLLKPYFEEQA